jgi:hypothetical protein
MLTMHIPMLLALLGTALTAVVIFAPSRVPAPATMSFSPPPAPPAFERWEPHPPEPATASVDAAAWPGLIDRRASGCDAAARRGLVEALASVRTPWSDAILSAALDDEPDPSVRAAVAAALGVTARYGAGLA